MKVPLTPTRFLDRTARLYRDKVGIVCGETRLTYGAYQERVRRLANGLRGLGVGQGDRVAYLGMNCHRLLEPYYAVLPLGAILAPLNVRLSPAELVFILNDLEAKVLFSDAALKPLAEAIAPRVPSLRQVVYATPGETPEGWISYEGLLAASSPDAPEPADIDEDDVAEIFYTSGTTGRPKGVMLTHRNLYLHALQAVITLGLSQSSVQIVGAVPLFHVNGWGAPQYAVSVGMTQVIMPKFDAAEFCRLVEAEGVTLGMMVPSMLNDLVHCDAADHYNMGTLERIMIGGAPPPYTLLRAAAKRFGCNVEVGYGLSETTPIATLALIKSHQAADLSEDEKYRRLSLTGLPVIGVDMRVFDADDHEVPQDGATIGEIVIRGDIVTKGYWRRPEETEAAMSGGWFHTGDMATVDAEGYLQIVDRKKDVIISGGENISSVEIEDALYAHPAVRECAVIGVPHERWGEVPHAVVVLNEGAAAGEAELIEHVRGRLAHFKAPHGVTFMQELPKTGTGKIQKAALREPFWQGYERRVN